MLTTIALALRPIPLLRSSPSMSSLTSTITLDPVASPPTPLPNKHIPVCPPGPVPQQEPTTPPPSPSKDGDDVQQSLLYPPDHYPSLELDRLRVYQINATEVVAALDFSARQPLPDSNLVFPWLHGLHPHNTVQQTFFQSRKRVLRKTPSCLRGVTIVKADGELNNCRLKGAIAPQEILLPGAQPAEFLQVDPREGFSVRNFQIQSAKLALVSDVIVYGDDEDLVQEVAFDIASAQKLWRDSHEAQRHSLPWYNTFVCTSKFSEFEEKHPEIVSVNPQGQLTGHVIDFYHAERREMYEMTRSSEIIHNVWMGSTPDAGSSEECMFDILIECSDLARLNPASFRNLLENGMGEDAAKQAFLEFPSSGSLYGPAWTHADADQIIETCKYIWQLATYGPDAQAKDAEGDFKMDDGDAGPKKILIHCGDGYTESSLLGVAYYSFATGLPLPDAWLHLHTMRHRNFFAYPSDVTLLSSIAPRLLQESPRRAGARLSDLTALILNEPKWFASFDGSFPSRVLDYLYLGNLGHANNPHMLKSLGIGQILSVGELTMWRDSEIDEWGEDKICIVHGVQDNGIDPLMDEFERCLDFIDRGRRAGTATLVHCRVGVSRSATICIAEVMRRLKLSFPMAYCYVRARRLNVIIQPHLRFAYELLKWEEYAREDLPAGEFRRELEWSEVAREIASVNRPYARG